MTTPASLAHTMDSSRPQLQDNVSTLVFVIEELRRTLESAHKSLRRFLRDAESVDTSDLDDVEPTHLRQARQLLHQGVGALELVNVPEGALLLRASEGLVQRWVHKPSKLDAGGLEAVEQASFALIDYLGRHVAGKAVSALGLFPALRPLLERVQAERIHPADLWPHDWQWRTVAGPAEPVWAADARMQSEFERRLLLLVRTSAPEAAQALVHDTWMLAAGAARAGRQEETTFWRLAAGFFEAWGLGLCPSDLFVKRTGSRVMGQLRSRVKGEVDISDRLAQDLLFYCARAWPAEGVAAPALTAVHRAYALPPQTPRSYDEAVYGRHDPARLTQARKRTGAAQNAWSGAASGDTQALDDLREAFPLLGQSVAELMPGGDTLSTILRAAADTVASRRAAPPPALAMEVATSLLYLDAAFEDGEFDAPAQAARTVHLAQRIESVASGAAPQPLEPWMEELYRRVSDRLTLGNVVQELRTSLAETERLIDPVFRHPEDKSSLAGVPGLLGQMRGVLSVLDVPSATQTMLRMRDDITALVHPGTVPDADPWPLFQRLAANLGALGFLFDMLAVQPVLARALFRFDPIQGVLTPVMGRSQLSPDVIDRAQAIAEGLRHDELPLNAVSAQLQALADRHDVHAQPDLAAQVQSARAALVQAEAAGAGQATVGAAREHIVQAMDEFIASATAPMALDPLVPAPPPDTPPPLSGMLSLQGPEGTDAAGAPEHDEEMLGVFLEESEEVLAEARNACAELLNTPADVSHLTCVRRAFHTLKGSARMVGLSAFGDAAHSCEQLYNHWLAEGRPASHPLLTFTADAFDYLEAWAQAIGQGLHDPFVPDPLIAGADALRLAGEVMRVPLPGQAPAPMPPAATQNHPFDDAPQAHETDVDADPVSDTRETEEASDTLDMDLPTAHDALADTEVIEAPPALPSGEAEEVDLEVFQELAAAPVVQPLEATRPADLIQDWTATMPVAAPLSAQPTLPLQAAVDEEQPEGLDLELEDTPAPPPAPPWSEDRVIGPLRVPESLFSIYLQEADEQMRVLESELSDWSGPASRALSDHAVAAAHSLAGNSSTVGFQVMADLARALEHALADAQTFGTPGPQSLPLFPQALQELQRLLHLFAAGILGESTIDLVAEFRNWRTRALNAAQTAPAVDKVEAPVHRVHNVSPPPVVDADGDIEHQDQIDDDLFPVFEEEADELLPRLAEQMEAWTETPMSAEPATACMRTLHTFKGSARLAGAMRLGEMAHRLESAITRALTTPEGRAAALEDLQQRSDALRSAFEDLRRTQYNDAPGTQYSGLQNPDSVMGAWTAEPILPVAVAVPMLDTEPAPEPDPYEPSEFGHLAALPQPSAGVDTQTEPVTDSGRDSAIDWSRFTAKVLEPATERTPMAVQPVRVRASLLDRLVNLAGEVSITRSRLEVEVGQIRGSLVDLTDNLERLNRQLHDITLQADTQLATRQEAARAAAQDFDPLELDRYTRLQELTRMMAESVNDVATVRSALQRTLQTTEDELAVQARLTRELQTDLLRTRMIEFESLSDRLYRVVRQAAKETGTQVRFDIVGGSIEVDRGVLDRMTPAFEHLLRNCVTHGIESPADRQAAGKDPTGSIVVSLEQEGNEVTVEVRDDGRGLDLARIRARAVEMGLLAPDAEVGDKELAQFVFAPGLSTVTEVTELAGRGVGMDVVRSDVQALGGRVETRTQAGRGTRFKLVMPLTTVVTQVVLLRTGHRTIAVPSNLVELVQRSPTSTIERCYETGTYLYGGLKLPFYWLGALLHTSGRGAEVGRTQAVVVVRSAQQRVALHVDEVLGSHEVVVKNLGPQLSRVPCLAGMTLLASGAVALIYNPLALAAVYGASAAQWMQQAASAAQGTGESLSVEVMPPAPLVLVVDDSLTVRRVTKRLLEREGYRVSVAKDGLEALEALTGERPVVVLSDIEMPRMDGFDLLRNIRADAHLSQLPVIMITSRIARKHREIATELGVNHYLGKPYDEQELLALIRSYAAPAFSPEIEVAP